MPFAFLANAKGLRRPIGGSIRPILGQSRPCRRLRVGNGGRFRQWRLSERIRVELSFASLREQGSPELLRRGLFPTSKGVAEIRGLAETQRMRDVVDRHFRIA